MTLSSRDPHLGQRIVLSVSITHNQLYRQYFRTRNLFDKLSDIIRSMTFVFTPMCKRPIEIESGPERRTPATERLRYVCVDTRLRITAGFRDGACAGPKRQRALT